jgi:hypothetical protein
MKERVICTAYFIIGSKRAPKQNSCNRGRSATKALPQILPAGTGCGRQVPRLCWNSRTRFQINAKRNRYPEIRSFYVAVHVWPGICSPRQHIPPMGLRDSRNACVSFAEQGQRKSHWRPEKHGRLTRNGVSIGED